MDDLIARFANIFKGNANAHGVHIHGSVVDDKGKRQGESFTKSETVTLSHYKAHIDGITGLGIVPITEDNTCHFSAIDIDEYQKDIGIFRRIIHDRKLPIFPVTSKSGGLHIYVLWEEAVLAKDAIIAMRELVAILGLPDDTEIFPKQSHIKQGEIGNWINIPYYKHGEKQYLIDKRGLPVQLHDAVELFEKGKTSISKLKEVLEILPCSDGPPCLQACLLRGDFDNRNNFFLSYGVYAKAKYEDGFADAIIEANNSLTNPLPEKELQNTVIKSLNKQTYAYKCKQGPIVDFCKKGICGKRAHGINALSIPDLDYGEFRQFLTVPPYYEWDVSGVTMRFEDENEILMQHKFRALCIRHLHKAPKRLKDEQWIRILNQVMNNTITVHPENDELSAGAILLHHIKHFLCARAHGSSIASVEVEQVYLDKDAKQFVFRSPDLSQYLKDQKIAANANELRAVIKEKNAQFTRESINGKQTRLVRIPFSAFEFDPGKVEEEPVLEADFSDLRTEEWE